MLREIAAFHVHELDEKVDALAGGVGLLDAQDILPPEDRNVVFEDQFRSRIAVSDDGAPQDEPLARLQFDSQCHGITSAARPAPSAGR